MPKRKPPIPVYFTSLEIQNVRCFGDRQRLDLTDQDGRPARWTLILGDNGVGKTTILQCLAWMRLVPVDDFEVDSSWRGDDSGEPPPLAQGRLGSPLDNEENEVLESLLRDRALELTLGAHLAFNAQLSLNGGGSQMTVTERGKRIKTGVQLWFDAKRHLSKFKNQPSTKIETTLGGEFHDPVVVVYGANRQRGVQNLDGGDLDDPTASRRLSHLTELYDVDELLRDLDYASKKTSASRERKHLDRLREALVKILPGDEFKADDLEIRPPDLLDTGQPSGVCLKTFSGLVPLSALSLGYQTTLAWAADLAWRLLKRYPASPNPLGEPAVVLIDEIDLHLHPLWQLGIVDDLSRIFPGTQFVATSHSPLMVSVAETANFALLRKRTTDVEIVNDPEVVRSWRVDQILMSELFNVPRARDKKTERVFARRDLLVDKPSRSAAEEAELERLRLQISELPTAQDPADQKAMESIRKAAALLKKHKIIEQ